MKKRKKTYIEPENPKRMGRIILIIYLFHTVTLLAVILQLGWSIFSVLPMLVGAPIIVYMHVRQTKSYAFRAYFITILIWINISLYALYTDDFLGMLTSIGALTMLLTLYGLPNIFLIGNGFYTVLVLIHLFLLRDISFGASEDGMRTLTRVLSVYMIEILAYYFVRTQQESKRHLLQNIESLHRAEHSKDDFMANVSHEIRTPVNTICGMSEIVLHSELPQETRNYMYNIQTAGRNLLSIVSDILDFSELESGKISILQDSYNITSVVNDIVSTANAKNSDKHLELIVDCDPNMPETLIGDRQKICRIVVNVIDNAIKFTQEGGIVLTIGTRPEEYGVNLCITVQDTGIGIKPEILEKIFTSFNQADTRRNRAESGIGLGLAISKAMVNKMGGFLKIDSTYGQGTLVSIVIPQKVEDAAPCIAVREAHEKRILVYMHLERKPFPLLREGSLTAVKNMATRFDVAAFACRNLAEVKHRIANEEITNLFIGWEEYMEAPAYFEEIAGDLQVTLVIERDPGQALPEGQIFCIHAPLYALSVASILNGETIQDLHIHTHQNRFIAPDAHILVVDDNRMNLKVVEGLLRPYKLKVSTALSGQEALKKLRTKDFDFIFMDHMMPEMDGVETFHRIREKSDNYYQNVPVIALTANAVGNAREMFLAEGFADYLSKPIEMSALEHILRKFIPRGKMQFAGKEIPVAKPQDGTGNSAIPPTATDTSAFSGQTGNGTARSISNSEKVSASLETGNSLAVNGTATSSINQTDSASAPSVTDSLTANGIDVALGVTYCGGEMDDYLEIIRIYYADGEKNISRIQNALAAGDWKSYVIVTHTVKSTSKSIGAVALSDLAKELEAAGRELDAAAKAAESSTGTAGNATDAPTAQAGSAFDGNTLHPELAKRTEEMLAEYARVLTVLKNDSTIFPEKPSVENQTIPLAAEASSESPSDNSVSNNDSDAKTSGKNKEARPAESNSETPKDADLTTEQFSACCRELAGRLDSFDSESVLNYLESLNGQVYHGKELTGLFEPIRAYIDDFDFMGAADALAEIESQK